MSGAFALPHLSATNIAEYFSLGQCNTLLQKALSEKNDDRKAVFTDQRTSKFLQRGIQAQADLRKNLLGRLDWRRGTSSSLTAFLDEVRTDPSQPLWAEEVSLTGELAGVQIGTEGAETRADFLVYLPSFETDNSRYEVWECKSSFSDKLAHRFQLAVYAALIRNALETIGDRTPVFGKVVRELPVDEVGEEEEGKPGLEMWTIREFSPGELDILIQDIERSIGNGVAGEAEPEISRICSYCKNVVGCLDRVKKNDPVQLMLQSRRDSELLRQAGLSPLNLVGSPPSGFSVSWSSVKQLAQVRSAYYLGSDGPEVTGEDDYIRLPLFSDDLTMKQVFFSVAERSGKISAVSLHVRFPGTDKGETFLDTGGGERAVLVQVAEWIEDQLRSQGAYNCHFYCWSYDEFRLLVSRAHALSSQGEDADTDGLLAGLAGLLSQDYALGLLAGDTLEAHAEREDWIATTLKEELSRRLQFGCIGRSTTELSLLRWSNVDGLAEIWLSEPVAQLMEPAVGKNGIKDAKELRTIVTSAIWSDDFLSPEMMDDVYSDPQKARAWFAAHIGTMLKIEESLRPTAEKINERRERKGVVKPPAKIAYSGSPYSKFTRAKGLAEACRDFIHLNESRRRLRMQAALQMSPRELIRQGRVAELKATSWDGKAFWGEVEWPEGEDRESFCDKFNVALKGGLVFPVSDFDARVKVSDIECGYPVPTGRWGDGDPAHETSAGRKRVRFFLAGDLPEGSLGKALPDFEEGKTLDLHQGGVKMLWTRNFRLNVNKHLIERLRSPSAAHHWLADGGVGLPDDMPLSEEEVDFLQRLLDRVTAYWPYRKTLYALLSQVNNAAELNTALDEIATTLGKVSPRAEPKPDGGSKRFRQVLSSRASLVQGPPGTGKTEFAAWAILSWICLRMRRGETAPSILAVANTHRALDELAERLSFVYLVFRQALSDIGESSPTLRVLKVGRELNSMVERHEKADEDEPVERQKAKLLFSSREDIKDAPALFQGKPLVCLDVWLDKATLVPYASAPQTALDVPMPTFVAMTAWQAASYLPGSPADLMVVDEASMMAVADFAGVIPNLAHDSGQLFVMGDDRQLAPIVDTAWSATLRPEMRDHRPFESVFARMRKVLAERPDTKVSLDQCHRCPKDVRDVIADVYLADGIILGGKDRGADADSHVKLPQLLFGDWEGIRLLAYRSEGLGLYEATRNPVEVAIIDKIVKAAPLDEDQLKKLAIIAPYRNQVRALRQIANFAGATVDTVNRLQGGERETVVVSLTGSSLSLEKQADFLLDITRSNVAVSRAAKRLVVVCATEVLEFLPTSAELYDAMGIWKRINRMMFAEHDRLKVEFGTVEVDVELRGPPFKSPL